MYLSIANEEIAENKACDFAEDILSDIEIPDFCIDHEMYSTIGGKDNIAVMYPKIENSKVWEKSFFGYEDMNYLVYLIEDVIYKKIKEKGFWFNPNIKIDGNKLIITENWRIDWEKQYD